MSQDENSQTSVAPPDTKGGIGGQAELTRADLVIIGEAIRSKWKIPPQVMEALPSQIAKMFVESKSARSKQAAARILLQMAAENRATAHLAIQATQGQSPVIGLNGNDSVDTGAARAEERTNRVADVLGELRKIGLSFGLGEPEFQSARSDAEAGSVFDPCEDGGSS